MKTKLVILAFALLTNFGFSQQIITEDLTVVDSVSTTPTKLNIKEKSPLRASLYSAVLPGAGQLYNKKWIKAPIALGLVGTGIAFSSYYNGLQNKYRRAYIAELEGKPHEYSGVLNAEQLAVYQDEYKRDRDYTVALTILAYILNIVDATVDSHLFSIKNDPDFTFKPTVIQDQNSLQPVLGMNLNFKF
ncbi:MAG: hypothetical protein KBS93_02600 [Flavobacteriaceae bacterium]|nr:hypothetical protein [Candidatus Onthonaster equi]